MSFKQTLDTTIVDHGTLPVFQGDFFEQTRAVAKWTDASLQAKMWSPEKLAVDIGRRSANEIITDKDLFVVANCLDKTLVALTGLYHNGFTPRPHTQAENEAYFVLEELIDARYGQASIHSAIQLFHKQEPYVLDFKNNDEIAFYKGTYENPVQEVTSLQTFPLFEFVNPSKPFFDQFDVASGFKEFDLSKTLQRLQAVARSEEFYQSEGKKYCSPEHQARFIDSSYK